jgi:hypothetical protein
MGKIEGKINTELARQQGVDVADLMNRKLMLSLLRSNPHKERLVTELQIRGVTGIDASMKWNELCKLMKEHEKNKRVLHPNVGSLQGAP